MGPHASLAQMADQTMRRTDSKGVLAKIAILLLLFAVAGLSTLAKNSKYLPKSDPTHFLSNATKMNVGHLPVLFFAIQYAPRAKVVPVERRFRMLQPVSSEKIDLPQIGLIISLQHRSPPSLLA